MADAAVKFDLTATEYAQSARSSVVREKPGAKMKPTVAIVEDHPGCLENLTKLIAKEYEIVANGLSSKILFLTVHEELEFREGAFHAGANGYVFKSQMAADILLALKEVLAGRVFLSCRPK